MLDCFINCCFNSGTSLVSGVVIFSVLGYMANEAGVEVKDVAQGNFSLYGLTPQISLWFIRFIHFIGGPGLAFLVYPKAVSLMPLAPMWSFAFFFMLVLIGLDSTFVGLEGKIMMLIVLSCRLWYKLLNSCTSFQE